MHFSGCFSGHVVIHHDLIGRVESLYGKFQALLASCPSLLSGMGAAVVRVPLFFAIYFLVYPATAQQTREWNELKAAGLAAEFAPGMPWLNVERPLTFNDLKGKVVLLDFWTYGCINCIHVLVENNRLKEKYKDHLLVIGVHTPKFDNEKNIETLRNIVIRYGIDHPVVNDTNLLLGKEYGMRAWPTRVLIDPAGKVLGKTVGEEKYELLDMLIADLVEEHEAILDPKPIPMRLEKERLDLSILAAPGKIAASDKYVAISDTLHHRVILLDHEGKIQQIFGGKSAGKRNGMADRARFNSPQGLAFGKQGIYVADTGNHLIRYIDFKTSTVTTIAGNGTLKRYRRGEFDALAAGLASPWGLALQDNYLYIAMAGSHQIWRYDIHKGKIKLYAGSGREGIDDGEVKIATFSQPSGLSIQNKWLYVADAEDSAIRRIHLKKGQVETIVGTGLFDFGDQDGAFDKVKLQHVLGITGHSNGQLFIADTYNHKLKVVDIQKGEVTTIVGNGQPGNTKKNTKVIQLNEPGGVAKLGKKILIADTNNHRIVSYDVKTGDAMVWSISYDDDVNKND
jgi:thiol-disulfide isomerase/thioredoxin/flagellar basal body rod protein FlgG